MRPFRRTGDRLDAELEGAEARLIVNLAAQLITLLRDRSGDADEAHSVDSEGLDVFARLEQRGPRSISVDPVLARLLPDAYRDDEQASAEFRRLTEPGLIDRKVAQLRTVVADLTSIETVTEEDAEDLPVDLDEAGALAWLRAFTDLRLALASRLGIESETPRGPEEPDEDTVGLLAVYDWLGLVQESLVAALQAEPFSS